MQFIEQYLTNAKQLNVKVDSIIVETDGQVASRQINKVDLHELRSCSKILIAFAYGIAIQEQFKCKDSSTLTLDTKVYSTLQPLSTVTPDAQVKEWTIRTLLTHSTGYEKMMFNEAHVATVDNYKLLDILFATPIKYPTDTHFTYSNVEPYLLSVFFQENFGTNIADFINQRIFAPLQINAYKWLNFGNYCAAATGLYLNYIDFHKIAKLLYDNGRYEGKQIVPADWVKAMKQPQVHCPDYYKPERVLPKLDAGYNTWISRDGIIFRDGSKGQYIICDYPHDRLITIMCTQDDMSKVTLALKGLV